ncbi:MAG: phosphatidate cytidylyltransferase [Propionibacteriaceae bacterium]|jgi:phosphatidate cytidylyltransferase|nr:phosphatidate cytidylyltransferase [Propionibacteriaceae bacterium]
MAEGEAGKKRAGRDLPAALLVGFGLFFIVIAGLLWAPWAVVALLCGLCGLAVFEFKDAFSRLGVTLVLTPTLVGVVALIAGAYAAAVSGVLPWHWALWGALGGAVIWVLAWRMPKGAKGYVGDVAASVLVLGYLGVLASFPGVVFAMPSGALKAAAIFMCVVGSDTGGYALGATLGRHPMAPNISPKKTWEGFLGSWILAIAVGVLMAVFALRMPWWVGLLVAAVAVLFGTAGDLVESMVKRDVGIKDMSSVLPGHGGVMERLDSLLFAFPAGWALFALLGL